ncbi:hypothetical protein Tco_0956789, partial [Tanacetum coccineum]
MWYQSLGALDLGFKVLWSKNEGTDEVLEGTTKVHEGTDEVLEVTMADNRTMAQLLEAPTEGYENAIVVPEINANNFEIKHGLLNLVQNKQ